MLRLSTRVLVVLVCTVAAAAGQTCSSTAAPSCAPAIVASQNFRPLLDATAVSATTFHKTVDEVSLTFSVTDRKGRAVLDLSPADITVLDNKQPVPVPAYFSHAESPLRIGVLVDGSDSVADEFEFERLAAAEFLRQLMRPRFDEGFVVGFGAKWQVLQAMTADSQQMISALHPVNDGWLTSVYDAILAACSGEMSRPANGEIRRAIILLSDGQDNNSTAWLSEAIAAAQKSDITIYAVTRKGHHWDKRGEHNLRELTAGTGGHAYILSGPDQFANAFNAIKEELRSSYTVAFKPVSARDGRFHPVQVALRDPKLKVHARPGYFAPKP